jgi:hypothetical protein
MFSTISGNLLLARSKPRNTNYIGFWYSFGTARFENRRGEPLSETQNLRHCLNDSRVECLGLSESNGNRTSDFPGSTDRIASLSRRQRPSQRLAALISIRNLQVNDSPTPSANGIGCNSVR